MKPPNPYTLSRQWDQSTRDAYVSMPQYHGYAIALDFVKPKDVEAMEAQWREWCRKTPRPLWPTWLEGWKDRKAARARQ